MALFLSRRGFVLGASAAAACDGAVRPAADMSKLESEEGQSCSDYWASHQAPRLGNYQENDAGRHLQTADLNTSYFTAHKAALTFGVGVTSVTASVPDRFVRSVGESSAAYTTYHWPFAMPLHEGPNRIWINTEDCRMFAEIEASAGGCELVSFGAESFAGAFKADATQKVQRALQESTVALSTNSLKLVRLDPPSGVVEAAQEGNGPPPTCGMAALAIATVGEQTRRDLLYYFEVRTNVPADVYIDYDDTPVGRAPGHFVARREDYVVPANAFDSEDYITQTMNIVIVARGHFEYRGTLDVAAGDAQNGGVTTPPRSLLEVELYPLAPFI